MTIIQKTPVSDGLHVVFGAGPVGRAIARKLALRGHAVRVASRSGQASGLPSTVEVIKCDAMNFEAAIEAGRDAAVVYHAAAPAYHHWLKNFARLQRGIFLSARAADATLVVVENLYGYGIAGRLHEGLAQTATYGKGALRAQMTGQLQLAHRRGDLNVVIGRASDFVGPEVRMSALGERLWPGFLKGKSVSWLGDPDALHSFTYVPDFADMLITLGAEPRSWGRIWHAPSPPAVSFRSLMERASATVGQSTPRIKNLSKTMLRLVGFAIPPAKELIEVAYLFEEPLIMLDHKYRSAFGAGSTSWDEIFEKTIHWWQASLDHQPLNTGRSANAQLEQQGSSL